MLEDLDKIDWAKVNFPLMSVWIRGMASPDETIREASYYSLYDNHIFGSSIQHKVTPFIVPFLMELLTYKEVEGKANIVLMLMQLASATYSGLRRENPPSVSQETYDELIKGIGIYKNFENDINITIRQNVSDLLNYLK